MLINYKDVLDLVEKEKTVTVILKESRIYNGYFISITEPNFEGDCLIELKDKKNKYIKFKLSSINILEKQ